MMEACKRLHFTAVNLPGFGTRQIHRQGYPMVAKPKKPKWSDIKRRIKNWESDELLGLVKDLFEASAENRQFLIARLLQDEQGSEVLDPYRQRIHQAFYKRNGLPQNQLDLAGARKAIRDYQKATADLAGTTELSLEYLETGTELTLEFGDIDEAFYDSLCSVLNEVHKTLSGEGHLFYAQFRGRLLELARWAAGIGWGYGDFVCDVVQELEQRQGSRT